MTDADKRAPQNKQLNYEGKTILRVYAVEYPQELNTVDEHTAYKLLKDSNRLYVKERTHGGVWSEGSHFSVDSFAQHIIDYWNKTDGGQEIDDVVKEISVAIDEAASHIKTYAHIGGEDKSDPESTTALVWLNALMFQELLHVNLDSKSLPPPM